jgi:hypothetical protein
MTPEEAFIEWLERIRNVAAAAGVTPAETDTWVLATLDKVYDTFADALARAAAKTEKEVHDALG